MSSASPSRARRLRPPVSLRHIALLLCSGAENAGNGGGQLFPFIRLDVELLAASCRQSIELGATIVLGCALLESDPPTLDEAVQRRVQRSLLDQQHVVRTALDRLDDGMTVRGTEAQGPQDQQIESALKQRDTVFTLGRHSMRGTLCPLT